MARALLAVLAIASVAACSPFGGGAFACSSDSQCGGPNARCINDLCSFSDSSCPTGFRFGDLAGGASNTCVGALDAGNNDVMLDSKSYLDAHVAMDGVYCYGVGLVTACFMSPPSGNVTLTTPIDTNGGACSTMVMGSVPWCVIAADTITAPNGTTAITGGKPLVLVAVSTITINGTLDASSHLLPSAQIGANADAAGCNAGTIPVAAQHGGGAGGSLGGTGGNGGDGPPAASHGIQGAAFVPSALRGGCPGQKGDNGAGGTGGAGGHGGGAVYLIANTSITVPGVINASGAGGIGGIAPSAGGGGGGGGGMIGLDAPSVTISGQCFANGGGGAGGSGSASSAGNNGFDPSVTGAIAVTGGGSGGAGGTGAAGTPGNGGTGGNTSGGGGGGAGGGAVGVIRLHRAASIAGGGQISPPAI